MKTYEPKNCPITFGRACEEMWRRVVFTGESFKMNWKGHDYEIEVVMRPRDPPKA